MANHSTNQRQYSRMYGVRWNCEGQWFLQTAGNNSCTWLPHLSIPIKNSNSNTISHHASIQIEFIFTRKNAQTTSTIGNWSANKWIRMRTEEPLDTQSSIINQTNWQLQDANDRRKLTLAAPAHELLLTAKRRGKQTHRSGIISWSISACNSLNRGLVCEFKLLKNEMYAFRAWLVFSVDTAGYECIRIRKSDSSSWARRAIIECAIMVRAPQSETQGFPSIDQRWWAEATRTAKFVAISVSAVSNCNAFHCPI